MAIIWGRLEASNEGSTQPPITFGGNSFSIVVVYCSNEPRACSEEDAQNKVAPEVLNKQCTGHTLLSHEIRLCF